MKTLKKVFEWLKEMSRYSEEMVSVDGWGIIPGETDQ